MTSITQVFLVSKEDSDIFLILVPLEILSHYPNIDKSHWLRKDVQLIIDKVFGEKIIV